MGQECGPALPLVAGETLCVADGTQERIPARPLDVPGFLPFSGPGVTVSLPCRILYSTSASSPSANWLGSVVEPKLYTWTWLLAAEIF